MRCSWNSRSSSLTSLRLRHEMRRPQVVVIGWSPLGVARTIRSLTKTNPRMLSRLSRNTGMREYSCSRNSARSSSSVASADRDDVGPRRHHFADERVAEVDDRFQQLALLLLSAAGSSASSGAVDHFAVVVHVVAVHRHRRVAFVALMIQQMQQPERDRLERPADDAEARQQQLEHALGIARHDEKGHQEFADGAEGHHRDHEERRMPALPMPIISASRTTTNPSQTPRIVRSGRNSSRGSWR